MIALRSGEGGVVCSPRPSPSYVTFIHDEARRKGVKPIASIGDLRGEAGFDEEGELEEFLAWLDAERHPDAPRLADAAEEA